MFVVHPSPGGERDRCRDGARSLVPSARDLGLFQAECQTGRVTFVVRADDGSRPGDIRALLPRYVAAEPDRIGCGPLRITVPEGA